MGKQTPRRIKQQHNATQRTLQLREEQWNEMKTVWERLQKVKREVAKDILNTRFFSCTLPGNQRPRTSHIFSLAPSLSLPHASIWQANVRCISGFYNRCFRHQFTATPAANCMSTHFALPLPQPPPRILPPLQRAIGTLEQCPITLAVLRGLPCRQRSVATRTGKLGGY
ncbi:hypothetical protein TRVL_09033 [Trypanosoma vivax]|uniref:Uncharacterized protein n=1 Tax=Trypanosoma vivax (strain Y486) TaxID=1055687 RepID=G0UAK1_TRYVY|nr:hypothetical protein TRVL_09033 [Trypanosoma vivax]CCC52834.1 hypothetical protein, unlikely [Trypanosoma vivax Y486]